MSKYFTLNIPWSSAKLGAQTVIDHYVNRYAERVFLDFEAGETWPMVFVPVLAGFVATGALWYNWTAGETGSGFLSSVAALTSTVGSGVHFVLLKDIVRQASLVEEIKRSLQLLVVWKTIKNDVTIASIEDNIHDAFNEISAVNYTDLSFRANVSAGSFFLATTIYFWTKKKYCKNYKAQEDIILYILGGNVAISWLLGGLVQKEVALRTTLIL